MKIEKGFFILLFAHLVSAEHVGWEVKSIINNSDLVLKNAEAFYGDVQSGQQIHEPITKQVRENSSDQIIPVDHLDSSVGNNSQGFNTLSAQDAFGKEYMVRFDGQRAIRVDRGREKPSVVVTQGLGKNLTKTGSVARVELVTEVDGQQTILSSDAQAYTEANSSFSIILSGKQGIYSVTLE